MKKVFNFSAYAMNHGCSVTKNIEVSDASKNYFIEDIMSFIFKNGCNKVVTVEDLPNWCKHEVLRSWGVNNPWTDDKYPADMTVCCDIDKFSIVLYVVLLSEN